MEAFPRYWSSVRGIHRSPVNSPDKGKWRGALMFSLICAWTNGWANNQEADELRRHHAHYEVTVIPGKLLWLLISHLLTYQIISNYNIGCTSWIGSCFRGGRIPTASAVSLLKENRSLKYIFMFPEINPSQNYNQTIQFNQNEIQSQ